MDAELTQLARTLVDPKKEVRDSAIDAFTKYAKNLKDVTDLHMAKLWKALYYCLWLTDKDAIQREVSTMIVKLMHAFKTLELRVLYIKTFYVTIMREWSLVDQYRANKLYVLMRFMLRELFDTMVASNFESEMTNAFLHALEQNALTKTPNGVRFHICDIFLEELAKATNSSISSMNFVTLIQPFFTAINADTDNSYKNRVGQKIFTLFLSDYAAENKDKECAFRKVNTKLLQAMIFELASADAAEVSESARKRLYAIHKEFQAVTHVDCIDVATALAQGKEEKKGKKDKGTAKKTDKMEKKKTNKVEKMVVEDPVAEPEPEPAVTAVTPKEARSDKKRTLTEEKESVAAAAAAATEKSTKKAKKATEVVDKSATVVFEKAVKTTAAGKESTNDVAKKETKPTAAVVAEKTTAKSPAEKAAKSTAAAEEAAKNKALLKVVANVKPSVQLIKGVSIEVTKQVDSGAKVAVRGKRVKMHYTGKLRNGKVFDSSVGKKPFSFRLGAGEVIGGWDIGIEGMKVGEKRILTIPPEKGYGRQGSPPVIPGNATLIFEVQCLDVMG